MGPFYSVAALASHCKFHKDRMRIFARACEMKECIVIANSNIPTCRSSICKCRPQVEFQRE